MNTQCGYVAIVGRPNVGKSTLINQLVGEKVSIISAKPQTTRWQVLGIEMIENTETHAQIVYIDTPGIHRNEERAMNRYLNRIATSILLDADIILWLVDATTWNAEDEMILAKLAMIEQPVILVINKIDLLADKKELLPLIEKLSGKFPFKGIVPISALKSDNLTALKKTLLQHLPENPFFFPEDQLTDKSILFQCGEIIREKLINETNQELPYATAIEIEEFKEEEKRVKIHAIIWVERRGQKIIIIGKKGAKLKKIGSMARRDIENILNKKVFLHLWIRIKEDWTDNERSIQTLGYH